MKQFFIYSKYLFLNCLLWLSFVSFSQSKLINLQKTEKHFSVADGLSSRQINSSFIDKNKQIWFLTDNKIGLFEFGKINNFLLSKTFSNRGFNSAYEDAAGNFWISENVEWYYPFNVQRCVIFNPTSHRTISVENYVHQKIAIHSIVSDAQHQIFIGTKEGQIFRFDAHKKVLQLISTFSKMPVKLLYANKRGLFACLEKDSRRDNTLIQLNYEGQIMGQTDLKGVFVRSLLEVENKLFYVTLGLRKIGLNEIGTSFKKSFPTSVNAYLSNITYSRFNKILIFNDGKIITFYDKKYNLILRENCNFETHEVTQDTDGNFILSTNNGVHIMQFNERKFRTFLKNNDSENINKNFSCRKILKVDDDRIIVNTNQKRQLINLKSGVIKPLNDFKNEDETDPHFVLSSLKDKNGDLLFGEDALVRTNVLTMRDEVLCNFANIKIWAITEYKDGYLLGLERKGLIYYDKKAKKTTPFSTINFAFENSIIYDFFVDRNNILVASESGFYQLTNKGSTILKKIEFPVDKDLQMMCFSIQKDKRDQQQLLLATLNGIWIYDLQKQCIRSFLQEKKYERKKYLSAYSTKNGVWASTEEGIWHFDDEGNLMKIYTVADGLTSNEFNRLAHFQDENDVLYFGGINGLNILNPSDFSTKSDKKFNLKIDSIFTYQDTTKSRVFANFKNPILPLNRGENTLRLIFSFEDFKYTCDKKYYYRTDKSLTKEWQLLTDRRLLLNNVDYGTTTIETMAVSCDDFLNANTQKIIINRPNPLYLTWYFWIITLVLISFLTWGIIKYSTNQLKQRNELLQRKVDEQTLSLQESLNLKETLLGLLVHDVRYPVQSFYGITKKMAYLIQKNDLERLFLLGTETENKSRKVLWLIDELVYWVKSTNTNFKINRQKYQFGELIQQIFDIYEDELQEKSLTYTITNADISGYVEQGLFIIVMRNLIFNAVIHSKIHTKIRVVIESENDNYQVIITNEFEEIQKSIEKGLGMGMTLLQPSLKKADFKIESSQTDNIFISKLLLRR